MKRSQRQWLPAMILSLLLVGLFSLPQVSGWYTQVVLPLHTGIDTLYIYGRDTVRIVFFSFDEETVRGQLMTLETNNRNLQTENQSLKLALERAAMLASQTAFLSTTKAEIPVHMSKDARGWFARNTAQGTITSNSALFRNGVLVGKVLSAQNELYTVSLLAEETEAILVRHEPSKKIGTLRIANGIWSVEFFEKVDGVTKGDRISVVPTTDGILDFFLIATVESIDTTLSHPTTKVLLNPLASVQVGDVLVVRGAYEK